MNSEMLPGASAWLLAIPSKARGLAMEPEEFITELKVRLGADQCPEDSWCSLCDCVLDKKARHSALCASGGERLQTQCGPKPSLGFRSRCWCPPRVGKSWAAAAFAGPAKRPAQAPRRRLPAVMGGGPAGCSGSRHHQPPAPGPPRHCGATLWGGCRGLRANQAGVSWHCC